VEWGAEGAEGVGCGEGDTAGRGCPPPLRGWVWGGGCAPSPEKI